MTEQAYGMIARSDLHTDIENRKKRKFLLTLTVAPHRRAIVARLTPVTPVALRVTATGETTTGDRVTTAVR